MPSAFETGQRMGMEAVQAGSNQAQIALRTREARREFDIQDERQHKQREIENAMSSNRQNMIAGEYLMKQKLLMQDMQRLTSAENAFNQFQTELATLDKGAQDFPQRYSDLTLRYVPTIAEHEQVNRKFSALNDAITKGTEYANKVAASSSLQQLVRDLAVYGQGAEAMAIQADVKAGKMGATEGITALNFALAEAKQARELADEERKIAGQERVAAARAGASNTKAEQTVDVETKGPDGAIIKRKLTAEQYQKEQDAQREQSEVASLVKTYNAESSRFWGKEEGKANAAKAAAQLRAKGYNIDGSKLDAKDDAPVTRGSTSVGRFTVEVEGEGISPERQKPTASQQDASPETSEQRFSRLKSKMIFDGKSKRVWLSPENTHKPDSDIPDLERLVGKESAKKIAEKFGIK